MGEELTKKLKEYEETHSPLSRRKRLTSILLKQLGVILLKNWVSRLSRRQKQPIQRLQMCLQKLEDRHEIIRSILHNRQIETAIDFYRRVRMAHIRIPIKNAYKI